MGNISRSVSWIGWSVIHMPATVVSLFALIVNVCKTLELWGQSTSIIIHHGSGSLFWMLLYVTLFTRSGAEIDRLFGVLKLRRLLLKRR